jgi:hypothetical protein
LPPVSESIVVLNPFDEKLAGSTSGLTICYPALPAKSMVPLDARRQVTGQEVNKML